MHSGDSAYCEASNVELKTLVFQVNYRFWFAKKTDLQATLLEEINPVSAVNY